MLQIKSFFSEHLNKIVIALLIIIIGYFIAKASKKLIKKVLSRSHIDKNVVGILSQIIYFFILLIILISALSVLNFNISSLLAAVGALGIAIGLAIQNNISNFASGILILIFKPFKIGDYILVDNIEGTVTDILILNTHLINRANKKIIIPNNFLTSKYITNYNVNKYRKLELYIGINYDNDHKEAIKILEKIFKEDPDIEDSIKYDIGIRNFLADSVEIIALPSVPSEKYWPTYYRVLGKIKDEFDKANIDIPLPQRVVKIKRD